MIESEHTMKKPTPLRILIFVVLSAFTAGILCLVIGGYFFVLIQFPFRTAQGQNPDSIEITECLPLSGSYTINLVLRNVAVNGKNQKRVEQFLQSGKDLGLEFQWRISENYKIIKEGWSETITIVARDEDGYPNLELRLANLDLPSSCLKFIINNHSEQTTFTSFIKDFSPFIEIATNEDEGSNAFLNRTLGWAVVYFIISSLLLPIALARYIKQRVQKIKTPHSL